MSGCSILISCGASIPSSIFSSLDLETVSKSTEHVDHVDIDVIVLLDDFLFCEDL